MNILLIIMAIGAGVAALGYVAYRVNLVISLLMSLARIADTDRQMQRGRYEVAAESLRRTTHIENHITGIAHSDHVLTVRIALHNKGQGYQEQWQVWLEEDGEKKWMIANSNQYEKIVYRACDTAMWANAQLIDESADLWACKTKTTGNANTD